MNKYLPLVLIVAVILLGGAGFFYVSSQNGGSIMGRSTFGKLSNAGNTASPSGVKTDESGIKKATTLVDPTESVIASMIPLSVTSPQNGSSTTTSKIQVAGKTLPNVEVFVNDVSAKADKNGNFKVSFTLDEGENYILVFANDENGNYAQQEMTVTYTAP